MKAVDHSPKPVLTVAIQKIPRVAAHVIVAEINMDLKLLPKVLAVNQNMNTRTMLKMVSQRPHIKALPNDISPTTILLPKNAFILGKAMTTALNISAMFIQILVIKVMIMNCLSLNVLVFILSIDYDCCLD